MKACPWCGQYGHTRVTSKQCTKNKDWKRLKTAKAREQFKKAECSILTKDHDLKRKHSIRRKESRQTYAKTSKRKKSRQTYAKTSKRKESCQTHAKTSKRKEYLKTHRKYNDRRRQTLRYMEQARRTNIYKALRHRFAGYAAADLAARTAGYVHQTQQEVIDDLTILKDDRILQIKKRWDKHCAKGANRAVCATCGIIGLTKPTKFSISENVIAAFQVGFHTSICLSIGNHVCT